MKYRSDQSVNLTPAEVDANFRQLAEGNISTSTTIKLNITSGWSHRATGINPLTGALTIDLTGVVDNGWATVFWTSPDGSWPTVTVTNGTGKGVAGADITAITKTIGSLPGSGNYNVSFDYVNGVLSMWSVDASGASSGGDTTPPVLTSATVENAAPSSLVLTYNESLDATSTPATTDFSVNDGVANAVTNVSVSGTTVTLTLTNAIDNGDTVTVSYTAGTNPIRDTSSNNAANLTSQSVTNNVAAGSTTYGLSMLAANTDYIRSDYDPNAADFSIYITLDSFTGTVSGTIFGTRMSSPSVTDGAWYVRYKSANIISLRLRDSGVSHETADYTIAAGDIVGVVRSGTSMSLMINGSAVETLTISAGFTSTAMIMFGAYAETANYATQNLSALTIDGNVFLPTTQNTGAITVAGITLTPRADSMYYAL